MADQTDPTPEGSTSPQRRPSAPPPAQPSVDPTGGKKEPGILGQFFAPVAGFGVTFATMFRKVPTQEYPEVKRPTAKRFHGRHQLNRHPDGLEKCVGCELCAWACPADAIYVEGADNIPGARFSPGERYGRVYQINYLRCIFCGLCIEACPTRALTMTNEYEMADTARQPLIYEKHQLLAPVGPDMPPAVPDGGGYGGARLLPRPGHRCHPGPEGLRRRARAGGAAGGPAVNPTPAPEMITGMEVTLFWVMAAIAVVGALGLLFARKAVHAAMAMAMVMVSLGVIYIAQRAEFVGIIQVFVYSGAVMMLFLFVVMLIGVDASDSMVETLRGQRLWAALLGLLLIVGAVMALTSVRWPTPDVTLEDGAQSEGTVTALAREIFERQVLPFEVLGALLVIAVMGAMVLAHRERLTPSRGQREMSTEALRRGTWLAGKPNPGVYARHNAADTPGLRPDGTPVEESVPRVLVARGQVTNPADYRLTTGTAAGEPPGDILPGDLPEGQVATTDDEGRRLHLDDTAAHEEESR